MPMSMLTTVSTSILLLESSVKCRTPTTRCLHTIEPGVTHLDTALCSSAHVLDCCCPVFITHSWGRLGQWLFSEVQTDNTEKHGFPTSMLP